MLERSYFLRESYTPKTIATVDISSILKDYKDIHLNPTLNSNTNFNPGDYQKRDDFGLAAAIFLIALIAVVACAYNNALNPEAQRILREKIENRRREVSDLEQELESMPKEEKEALIGTLASSMYNLNMSLKEKTEKRDYSANYLEKLKAELREKGIKVDEEVARVYGENKPEEEDIEKGSYSIVAEEGVEEEAESQVEDSNPRDAPDVEGDESTLDRENTTEEVEGGSEGDGNAPSGESGGVEE